MNAAELHKARFPDGEIRYSPYAYHVRGVWDCIHARGTSVEECDSAAIRWAVWHHQQPTEVRRIADDELLWRRIDWPPGSPRHVKPLNVKTYYGPAGAV